MHCKLLAAMESDYLDNLRTSVFDEHWERINEENRTSVGILLAFTVLIILVNLLMAPFVGGNPLNELIELAVYAALVLVVWLASGRERPNYTVMVYLFELPLLLIALVSGTVFQTTSLTFSFLFFLLVLPSIILDKPGRVLTFIWGLGCAFVVLAFLCKPIDLFTRDLQHALNVCMISSAECLCLLSARIKNIRYAAGFAEQALRDPLTGLYNRAGADRYVDASEPGALLFIDLDNFKQVNDAFGHAEGDTVLREVADALRRNFRRGDVIVRMGGDEFAVFAQGPWTADDIDARVHRTLQELERIRVTRGSEEVVISASIGCIVETRGCESFDAMVRLADREMYRVKTHGKGNYLVRRIDQPSLLAP